MKHNINIINFMYNQTKPLHYGDVIRVTCAQLPDIHERLKDKEFLVMEEHSEDCRGCPFHWLHVCVANRMVVQRKDGVLERMSICQKGRCYRRMFKFVPMEDILEDL